MELGLASRRPYQILANSATISRQRNFKELERGASKYEPARGEPK